MKIVQKMSIMEKAIALMRHDLFAPVPTDEVAIIASRSVEVEFEVDEVVEEGDATPSNFFCVVEGKVEQTRNGLYVRTAIPGTAFGLAGLLGTDEKEIRSRILEQTTAIGIAQEDFNEILADHPAFSLAFLRSMANSMFKMADRVEELEKKVKELTGDSDSR